MISDEVLYDRLVRGDLKALDTLYERHGRHLFGFIASQLRDRQEAEDVLHDTFMAVLEEKRTGRQAPTCFRAWLYQVARHLCLKRARSRERSARAMVAVAHSAAPSGVSSPSSGQPEEELASYESSEALREAVARLPSPLAELFHLRAGGLSYDELAQVLRIPIGTVKSRMHELVSRLRTEVGS